MDKDMSVPLMSILFEQLKNQGFSLILLCIAVFFFYNEHQRSYAEYRRLEDKVDTCNAEMVEMLRTDRDDLKEVIRMNTEAFNKIMQER